MAASAKQVREELEMSDVKLTLAQQDYVHVSWSDSCSGSGHRDAVYQTTKAVSEGKRKPDLLILLRGLLTKLIRVRNFRQALCPFRNRLFHGASVVDSQDGSVKDIRCSREGYSDTVYILPRGVAPAWQFGSNLLLLASIALKSRSLRVTLRVARRW